MKLFIAKLKDKFKSGKKTPIILTIIISLFIIGAIAALIATIYLTGSTFGEFMGKYYPWFVIGFALIIVVASTVIYLKYKKGK